MASTLVYWHFSGDMDTVMHLFAQHIDPIQFQALDDGTYLLGGSSRHSGVRDELSQIPGVTLFPSKHGGTKLGDKASLLKGMKKAPQATDTLHGALSNLGVGGYFDPEF